MPTIRTLLIIGVVLFSVFWNLAAHQSLTQAIGNAYVALSVACFTLAWVVALVFGIVWLSRLVAKGEAAERLELLKVEQDRVLERMGVVGR
jgi:hypothetical protein